MGEATGSFFRFFFGFVGFIGVSFALTAAANFYGETYAKQQAAAAASEARVPIDISL